MPELEVQRKASSPQPDSPYGIKGVGEIGLVPTAGAVAAAVAATKRNARRVSPTGEPHPPTDAKVSRLRRRAS